MKRAGCLVILALAGCVGPQSALDPAGIQAEHIGRLGKLFFGVCLAVYIMVGLFLAVAVIKRGGRRARPVVEPTPQSERRLGRGVSVAVVVSIASLFVLLIGDFVTGQALHEIADPAAPKIRVTGHQWWWEVQYDDPSPDKVVKTANELHVPLGKTVQIELLSADVIHSFWVPNLHGKRDMIPGHPTKIYLRADRAGVYWGQCAEYCGHQHANMRLAVTAEPESDYARWLDAQRQPAPQPTNDRQRRGQQVFLGSSCVMCHTVHGTLARATIGPNLTHVGSRPWIGAGARLNTRGHLAGWIADPQRIKPGVRMPLYPLPPEDLLAVVDFLEALK